MQAEPGNLPTGREFLENLKKEEGKTVSMIRAYRAFQSSKEIVFGTETELFQHLQSYLEGLQSENPGSVQYFITDSDNRFVRCAFIAPYAANFLRNGLPVIQADMAHFRKTKFSGMTPTIVGVDGNRHITFCHFPGGLWA